MTTHSLPREADDQVDIADDPELFRFVMFGVRPDPFPMRWLRILADAGEVKLAEQLRRELRA